MGALFQIIRRRRGTRQFLLRSKRPPPATAAAAAPPRVVRMYVIMPYGARKSFKHIKQERRGILAHAAHISHRSRFSISVVELYVLCGIIDSRNSTGYTTSTSHTCTHLNHNE